MFGSRHILFTLALLFIKEGNSQVIQPQFNLIRGTNEVSLGKVNGIAQDRFGYMWFADNSNGCLVRYDGYRMKIFSHNPADTNSLNSGPLECITSDASGNIWIGTWSGADKFDPSTNRFLHYNFQTDTSRTSAQCILIDHLGYLWLGTPAGLVCIDPRTRKFTIYRHSDNDVASLSCNMVRSLYEDKAGVLWVGTGMAFDVQSKCGGLNKFDRNTGHFTQYLHNPNDAHSLAGNKVRAMFEDSKGIFWVGTDGDGLHIMDRGTETFTRLNYDPRQPGKLSRPPVKKENPFDHITFITEDRFGKLWIGTYNEGIVCYDPVKKILNHFRSPDKTGLADDNWCACVSRDGVVWISTEQANLFRVDPFQTGFSAVKMRGTLSRVNDWAHMLEDEAGNLWTTARPNSEGLTLWNPKLNVRKIFLHSLNDPYSLSDNNVCGLARANNKQLWVGSLNGANLYNPETNTFTRYFYNRGGEGRRARLMEPQTYKDDTAVFQILDTKDETYFGTSKGLFVRNRTTGEVSHYFNDPKDSTSLSTGWGINSLCDKGDGNIWMAVFQPEFEGGAALNLFNSKTKKFKHYLTGREINGIFKSSDGRVWAATRKGLYYENDSLDTFLLAGEWNVTFKNAMFRSITEDKNKNIWGVSSLGIFRLNVGRNELGIYGHRFGAYVGLGYQLSYATSTGELIFGNTEGYYKCFPHDVVNPFPPKVLLTDFKMNGTSIDPSLTNSVFNGAIETAKEINLEHDQNIFSIDFAAIHFGDPENNTIQYKLDGYENTWRTSGMEKTAYYFNIPPAHYVFRVRAASSYGVNSETAIGITVYPPWWQTWWFRMIAIATLGVSLYLIARWWFSRTLKLKLEHSDKEKQVAELKLRTTELEMQALRAQMNPHFIFNSLNSINMFILENNKLKASEYLSKFSRLIRLILQNSQETFIPLERELEALGLYLELESLRFEDKFDYKISVDPNIDTTIWKVAPLIIQPYVENAIWHGLMHKKEKGHVDIEIHQEEKMLFCKIVDDGIGRKHAAELHGKQNVHKSIGMRITADRIALLQLQKDKSTFISITDRVLPNGEPAGTEVSIKMSFQND